MLYITLSNIYVLLFIVSNISATKLTVFYNYHIDLGTIYFPILYIINDIITETYGFAKAQLLVWKAIIACVFVTTLLYITSIIPGDTNLNSSKHFDSIMKVPFRVTFFSTISFLVGEYCNSRIMSSLKIYFKGKFFNIRCILSTFVGSSIESAIFSFAIFYTVLTISQICKTIIFLVVIKVCYEIFFIPITSFLTKKIKKNYKINNYDKEFKVIPISELKKQLKYKN